MNIQDAQLPKNKVWQTIEANKNKRYGHHYNFPLMTQVLKAEMDECFGKNIYPDNTSKRSHLKAMNAAKRYLESKGVQ